LFIGAAVAGYEEDGNAGVSAGLQVASHLTLTIRIQPILRVRLHIERKNKDYRYMCTRDAPDTVLPDIRYPAGYGISGRIFGRIFVFITIFLVKYKINFF
jgi:hypothetical protein